MRTPILVVALAALVSGACSASGTSKVASLASAAAGDRLFATWRDSWFDEYLAMYPQSAVRLGFHRFDGQLADASAAGLEKQRAWLHASLEAVDRVDAAQLSPTAVLERAAIRNEISSRLFNLESLRSPWRNPTWYARLFNIADYVSRDYAPLETRARAIVTYAGNARQVLADAQANLKDAAIPRPWLELGLMIAGGAVSFVKNDVAPEFAALAPPAKKELEAALAAHAADLERFIAFLGTKREAAPAEFAIGAELYLKGLADVEGLVVDLPTLERVVTADTERNLAALNAAAQKIAPGRPTAEVLAEVQSHRPTPETVLDLARHQAAEARAFLMSHPIVGIPSEHVAEVRVSPPFSRFNPASLSSPGVFEEKSMPSFYYITPPDPTWPVEQQKSYLTPDVGLLFTTVHEVWPGHFLQDLYLNRQPSRILKALCSYANSEGWAHYTEEMMWDEGFRGGDPKVHIGQLLQALMRDARFIAAVGMHTRGMSVEDATKVFMEKAFLPLAGARQQAMRGTSDAFYLNYTLGKLMIMKLRDDWKAKMGEKYSLQAFHETFLGDGCLAIPAIRQAMVGGGSSL